MLQKPLDDAFYSTFAAIGIINLKMRKCIARDDGGDKALYLTALVIL